MKTLCFLAFISICSCVPVYRVASPTVEVKVVDSVLPVVDSLPLKIYNYVVVNGEKIPVEVTVHNSISTNQQIKRENEIERKNAWLTGIWSAFAFTVAFLTVHSSK